MASTQRMENCDGSVKLLQLDINHACIWKYVFKRHLARHERSGGESPG